MNRSLVMGSTISIDKHVSNLDDLLEMKPASFTNLHIDSKGPEGITQHLKVGGRIDG